MHDFAGRVATPGRRDEIQYSETPAFASGVVIT